MPVLLRIGRDDGDTGDSCNAIWMGLKSRIPEVLGMVLLTYLEQGKPLPKTSKRRKDLVAIAVEPEIAAKLAVIEAFKAARITQGQLASRLGKDGREVRRILDPNHATKLPALTQALEAMGRRLVVGVEEIAA